MTLNKLQREVRRLDQRVRRANTRLNKLRLRLRLEGYEDAELIWSRSWALSYHAQALVRALQETRAKIKVAKLVKGA